MHHKIIIRSNVYYNLCKEVV